MTLVVDASVVAAWGLPDEASGGAVEAIAMRLSHERGIVPGMFWYGIRNVLIQAERRGRISSEQAGQFLERIGGLIEIDRRHDEVALLDFARQYDLTVYDAAYLETAVRRRADLATFDDDLAAAARAEDIKNPATDPLGSD